MITGYLSLSRDYVDDWEQGYKIFREHLISSQVIETNGSINHRILVK